MAIEQRGCGRHMTFLLEIVRDAIVQGCVTGGGKGKNSDVSQKTGLGSKCVCVGGGIWHWVGGFLVKDKHGKR